MHEVCMMISTLSTQSRPLPVSTATHTEIIHYSWKARHTAQQHCTCHWMDDKKSCSYSKYQKPRFRGRSGNGDYSYDSIKRTLPTFLRNKSAINIILELPCIILFYHASHRLKWYLHDSTSSSSNKTHRPKRLIKRAVEV